MSSSLILRDQDTSNCLVEYHITFWVHMQTISTVFRVNHPLGIRQYLTAIKNNYPIASSIPLNSPPQSQAAPPSPSRNYPIFYQKICKKCLLPHTQTKKFRLPRFSTANKSLIHSFTQQFHRNSGKIKS